MRKLFRKLICIVVSLVFVLCMEGCWDLKDINEKLIVTALLFDLKEDEIWFYLEVANTETGGGPERHSIMGSNEKFLTFKSHGKTLPEARENLDEQLEKPLYLSGARTLVFTEEFANEYLVEYLYRFRADETYRKQCISVITKDDPEELLNKTHEAQESIGLYIEGEFESLEKLGMFFHRSSDRIIENLSDDYSGFLMPCISLENGTLALVGYSVLCSSKVTGFIPVSDTKIHGIYFIKVDKPRKVYLVTYKDIDYTIEVKMKKRKVDTSYSEGNISMNLAFDFSGVLQYGNKKTPYKLDENDLQNISSVLGDVIRSEIDAAIDQAQHEFNCDYLQFDDRFRIKYPDEFEEIDWNEQFSKISTTVEVNVQTKMEPGLDYGPKMTK